MKEEAPKQDAEPEKEEAPKEEEEEEEEPEHFSEGYILIKKGNRVYGFANATQVQLVTSLPFMRSPSFERRFS